jgi:hypothetical protein
LAGASHDSRRSIGEGRGPGDADGSSPTQLDASAELHQLRRAVLDGRVLSGEEATRALDIARSVVSPAPGCATED